MRCPELDHRQNRPLPLVVQIEARLAWADRHSQLDNHFRPHLSFAVVEDAEIALAGAADDGLEDGAVRHIRIRMRQADSVPAGS